jgi:hypothetical protein
MMFSICLAVGQFPFAEDVTWEVRRVKVVREIQLDESTSFGALYQSSNFFIWATISL